ncbi:PEP-CTERM sorting domain-containing protein [Laspinema olomoucense]|uniref:PEP-CTERM sorting domain-containing protein n=1 Tax=Laspinema olomoucense TaxID=3231600 RepID=UPI0021BB15F6|nr:PEP-CTERM sorting domain-containing protein [Laspinema sp. D3c]MCT7993028.1 PEP-CTERM sorting domain-containing protein [Laspinema sp. D3c]
MNFQRNFLSVATVTTILSLVSALPADAFTFGNSGFRFDTDTTVNFEFLQSNGWWLGQFGVMETATRNQTFLISEDLRVNPGGGSHTNSLGTAGSGLAVENPLANFTFKAGIEYSLFLASYDVNTPSINATHYSTNNLNPDWYRRGTGTGMQGDGTFKITGNAYDSSLNGMILDGRQRTLFQGDLFSGMKIFFEDNTTWGDNDFDDFVFSARIVNSTSVPEPATLAGLAVVAGAATLLRRRKQGHIS